MDDDRGNGPTAATLAGVEGALDAARGLVEGARAFGYPFGLLYADKATKDLLRAGGDLAPLADEGVRVAFGWATDEVRRARGDEACEPILLGWGADPFGPAAMAAAAAAAPGEAAEAGDATATKARPKAGAKPKAKTKAKTKAKAKGAAAPKDAGVRARGVAKAA